jgi:hypothetical protein
MRMSKRLSSEHWSGEFTCSKCSICQISLVIYIIFKLDEYFVIITVITAR